MKPRNVSGPTAEKRRGAWNTLTKGGHPVKHSSLAVGATVAACLLTPTLASAHTAVVTCDPNGGIQVSPDYRHLSPTWTVTATGVVVTWSDGYQVVRPRPRPGPPPPEPPGPPPGPCPTPQSQPEPPPPPVEQPRPTPPPTCADLLARYPLAGKARRASWGCPVTSPKRPTTKPKPKPRVRVVTCRFVVTHYRGAARDRMIHRYRLPLSCGKPYTPPVMG